MCFVPFSAKTPFWLSPWSCKKVAGDREYLSFEFSVLDFGGPNVTPFSIVPNFLFDSVPPPEKGHKCSNI